MSKIAPYDTVILKEPIGPYPKGAKGAVIECYTIPYEAYDIEIVTDEGVTKGILEDILADQIEKVTPVCFVSIDVEANGDRATVRFSDGTETILHAGKLYTQRRTREL